MFWQSMLMFSTCGMSGTRLCDKLMRERGWVACVSSRIGCCEDSMAEGGGGSGVQGVWVCMRDKGSAGYGDREALVVSSSQCLGVMGRTLERKCRYLCLLDLFHKSHIVRLIIALV